MANTFELISSYNVGSGGVSSIDFTSIPNTYKDLKLFLSLRMTQAAIEGALTLRFNGSTTSYSDKEITGNGSSVGQATRGVTGSGLYIQNTSGDSSTINTFGSHIIYIPNYLSSNNKLVSVEAASENNGTTAYTGFLAGMWENSAAINQITFYGISENFKQHSTIHLYGIKNS